MNKTITIFFLFLCSSLAFGQIQSSFVVQRWDIENTDIESISFIRVDSTRVSQSTALEYKEFVVLLDLPIVESSIRKEKNFKKEIELGDKFLSFIKEYYNKPVKFVLVSHWHAHSISGIVPFLEKEIDFYMTSHNWNEALRDGLLPKEYYTSDYEKNIHFINKDTVMLADEKFPIDVLYLDSINYSVKPTKDFLVYYLPNINTLYVSCKVLIKEIDYSKYQIAEYSDRLLDIKKVINEKHLTVDNLIRLYYAKSPEFVVPYKYIEDIIKKGKSWNEIIEYFTNMDLGWVQNNQNSLLRYTIETELHPNLLRLVVYECLKQEQFDKAVILAQILCDYRPNNAFYINALGESYYRKGDLQKAMYYDALLKTMSSKYGINQWKTNIINTK
ncbi:MAG TPA: hypothetical protein GXZ87_07220 [Bacteroidales bacterium]|nr:hypothetical protein [Bacteroidales bacterium]